VQEAGAGEGDEGALGGGVVADHFLDKGACVCVTLERGFWVGELAGFCEEVGNCWDAVGLCGC
jgi:hypothetical protein